MCFVSRYWIRMRGCCFNVGILSRMGMFVQFDCVWDWWYVYAWACVVCDISYVCSSSNVCVWLECRGFWFVECWVWTTCAAIRWWSDRLDVSICSCMIKPVYMLVYILLGCDDYSWVGLNRVELYRVLLYAWLRWLLMYSMWRYIGMNWSRLKLLLWRV